MTKQSETSKGQTWSAVGSMALCVALLIASEFMPVSLLTPIAHDLHATEGMAGQSISISGLFAVVTSLFIATLAQASQLQSPFTMQHRDLSDFSDDDIVANLKTFFKLGLLLKARRPEQK